MSCCLASHRITCISGSGESFRMYKPVVREEKMSIIHNDTESRERKRIDSLELGESEQKQRLGSASESV